MKMYLVMILVKKVFISSKTMIIYLSCPLLCGLFFIWKGAKGELSYKVKKDAIPAFAVIAPLLVSYLFHGITITQFFNITIVMIHKIIVQHS